MAKYRKRILSSRKYSPQWKGFIEGFSVNYVNANLWRVKNFMDREDCMQEAYYVFLRLKSKYGRLDTPQHFMALFRTTLTNEFTDWAARDTKIRFEENHEDFQEDNRTEYNNDGELAIMIEQAPSDVSLVLQLMLTAPIEVLEMMSTVWKAEGKKKEFGNTHLCSILGLSPKTDIVGIVTDYFSAK